MQPCLLPCKALTGHARRGLVRRTFSQIVQSYPQPIPHLLMSSHQTLYSIPIPLLYRVLPTEAWTFPLYLPNFNPGGRVHRRQRFSSRSHWYCMGTITRVCLPSFSTNSSNQWSKVMRRGGSHSRDTQRVYVQISIDNL